ncbi:MAG: hypothetical protein Q9P14_17480, partial [candidate division KSB1 bacterium]|nr:hypothetical protein [candidate division KSB1 bacterium]
NVATLNATKHAIKKAAETLKFTDDFREFQKGNRHYLAFIDEQGHGLVVEVQRTDYDVHVKLDLTGYGDGQCHVVMNQLLKELERQGLKFGQLKRQSHYLRQGIWEHWFRNPEADARHEARPQDRNQEVLQIPESKTSSRSKRCKMAARRQIIKRKMRH